MRKLKISGIAEGIVLVFDTHHLNEHEANGALLSTTSNQYRCQGVLLPLMTRMT